MTRPTQEINDGIRKIDSIPQFDEDEIYNNHTKLGEVDTMSTQSFDSSFQSKEKEGNNEPQSLNYPVEEPELQSIFGKKNAHEMHLAMEILKTVESNEECTLPEVAFDNSGADFFSPAKTETSFFSFQNSPNPHEHVLEQSFLVDLAIQRTQKMAEIADELPVIEWTPSDSKDEFADELSGIESTLENKDDAKKCSSWPAVLMKFSKTMFHFFSELLRSLVCRSLSKSLQNDPEVVLCLGLQLLSAIRSYYCYQYASLLHFCYSRLR
mmetsp:Transcript_23528/g.34723  ORF Transcript_23528/g.34723 Transcript_23528/m.34723 type:complete len:267 (-) Transcript_23528:301-1101(-)